MKNNFKEFMSDFESYLYAIKNLSESYVKSMKTTIKQFLLYVNQFKYDNQFENIEDITLNNIRSVTNEDINTYIFHLAKKDYSQDTRAWKIEHLRTFFDFLYRIKHEIFRHPIKKIQTEKRKSFHLPNYLSLEESKKIIQLYNDSKKNNEIRNNAIINLCLNCGLRISEVASLNISELNINDGKFLIHGKGNKERTGYLNSQCKEALQKYLSIRKNIIIKKSKDKDALFISNKGSRISPKTIRDAVKISYEKTEIDSNQYSVHTLRHTCATILYKSGQDIKIIQELLGHSSVNTTRIYTHLYDKDVEKTMHEHPLSKFKIQNAKEYCLEI